MKEKNEEIEVTLFFFEKCCRTLKPRGEKERREGWEAQRAVGLLHDTANTVGFLPVMSRPPLHVKRPCSNRLRKTKKCGDKSRKMKN